MINFSDARGSEPAMFSGAINFYFCFAVNNSPDGGAAIRHIHTG
jgi:hypothetical protein